MVYKLYYFDLRARAECARQLFALAGEPYEDIRVSAADWPALKPHLPFGTMPCLDVDGVKIGQSITISRYLAKKFGFAGKTLFEQAQVDALADEFTDFYRIVRPFFLTLGGYIQGDKDQLLADVVLPARNDFFKVMNKFLEKSASGFLIGDTVTYADLLLAEHVSTVKNYDPAYTKDFPLIQAHWSKVRAIPNLKKWIESRPKSVY